jgi:hypothetical protein|nr:MAG TPA: protein of unknown function (DUF2175) [Caudoviricetes sp.]DAK14469.1 MAG TPA: protein of unknown function (DUF2175) [Bacteriophage sp.]
MNDYETKLHNQYLEPEEDEIFGEDWNGNNIYFGDEYFDIDGELVLVDEIEEFVRENYSKFTAGE